MHNGLLLAIMGSLLLLGNVGSEPSQFYYAINHHDLAGLAVFDEKLFNELQAIRDSVAVHYNTSKLIDAYLEDFNEGNGVDQDEGFIDLAAVTANPISTYRLIRRCYVMASQIIKDTKKINGLKLSHAVAEFPLPIRDDVFDAIDAILNIQSFYHINVSQFASGNIFGSVGRPKLRAVHCVEIGNRALKLDMYASAYEWFQEAKRLAPSDQAVKLGAIIENRINRIVGHLDTTVGKEKTDGNPGSVTNPNIFFDPSKSSPNLGNNPKIEDQLMAGGDQFFPELRSVGLCSGENLKTPQETAGQFCWLEFKIHAGYTIGPLQMEFLSRYPTIIQIHNAFFPTEIGKIRASTHFLSRSAFIRNNIIMTTTNRSSSTATMSFWDDVLFSLKVGRMVDLNVVGSKHTSELTQITSYAGGGYYTHHHDFDGGDDQFSAFAGNRLMTFMAYLNTVEQGGFTVFPRVKTYAEPIRGSAIFWFNVFSDGRSLDYALSHIACPVIKGQKWVATKWVRMHDQFLKKQCLLAPKERFQFPVNGQYLPVPEKIRKMWKQNDENYLSDQARQDNPEV